MNRTFFLFLFIIGLVSITLVSAASGTKNLGDISIRVDGLTCPFCSYGLEKKLKRLEGAEKIHIDIEKGIAYIQVRDGESIDENNLKKQWKMQVSPRRKSPMGLIQNKCALV